MSKQINNCLEILKKDTQKTNETDILKYNASSFDTTLAQRIFFIPSTEKEAIQKERIRYNQLISLIILGKK